MNGCMNEQYGLMSHDREKYITSLYIKFEYKLINRYNINRSYYVNYMIYFVDIRR